MPDRALRNQIRATHAIESQRPLFAFHCIDETISLQDKDGYKSCVKKMPAWIQSNGLAQTVGFMHAKSTNVYKKLLDQICDYMIFRELIEDRDEYSRENFIRTVISFDSFSYFQATEEVLLLIGWLRRLAEGNFREGN